MLFTSKQGVLVAWWILYVYTQLDTLERGSKWFIYLFIYILGLNCPCVLHFLSRDASIICDLTLDP